jgi:hypothetical protein
MKKKAKESDVSLDVTLGTMLGNCEVSGVICKKHPKYEGKRKPTSKYGVLTGCTCHMFWAYKTICEAYSDEP